MKPRPLTSFEIAMALMAIAPQAPHEYGWRDFLFSLVFLVLSARRIWWSCFEES